VELAIEFDMSLGGARGVGAVVLRHGPGGSAVLTSGPRGEETLSSAPPASGGGGPASLSLSLVDGVLRASAPGLSFESPVEVTRGEARLRLRGPVESLEISRDLHYTTSEEHAYATANAFEVPEGTVFMLGDRSHDSRDSRFRGVGPIPLERLSGRAVFRLWPLWRLGPLR
jgi:hypothetical protein